MPQAVRRIAPAGPPTSLTVPLLSEFSALALLSRGPVPTMAGVRACRAGADSTAPPFSATKAAYSTQYRPGLVPASITATAPAQDKFAVMIRRRRSHRSATTPATGPSSSSGRYWAARASPVSRSEPVAMRMCAGMASTSSQDPRELIRLPAHSSRKSGIRRARSTALPPSDAIL